MAKKRDGRCASALVDGSMSKPIQKIMKDLKLSAMDAVNKIDFKKTLNEVEARRDAMIKDSYTQKYFMEVLKNYGPDVLSYEGDLVKTQTKIIANQEKILFHKNALTDLQSRYIDAPNEEKSEIYEQIERCEKVLNTLENNELKLLELRNKVRKELDKKDFQTKSLDLKEDEIEHKKSKNMISEMNLDEAGVFTVE